MKLLKVSDERQPIGPGYFSITQPTFLKNGYPVEAPVLFWLTSIHSHVTLLEV